MQRILPRQSRRWFGRFIYFLGLQELDAKGLTVRFPKNFMKQLTDKGLSVKELQNEMLRRGDEATFILTQNGQVKYLVIKGILKKQAEYWGVRLFSRGNSCGCPRVVAVFSQLFLVFSALFLLSTKSFLPSPSESFRLSTESFRLSTESFLLSTESYLLSTESFLLSTESFLLST